MTDRHIGWVKNFNSERGFGFLRVDGPVPAGDRRDVFLHVSAVRDMPPGEYPKRGDRLSFEIELDDQGRQRAVNAKIESSAPSNASADAEQVFRTPRFGDEMGAG